MYTSFGERVRAIKRSLLRCLIEVKEAGGTIVGYGAPAKGTTLLNYCGIGTDFLDYTVDKSPHKQGHLLPGVRIPILEPGAIAQTRPDYVLRPALEPQRRDRRRDGGHPGVGRAVHPPHTRRRDRLMRLVPTPIEGVWVVEAEPAADERGLFARTFDAEAFAAQGLGATVVQCSTSFSARAGTLRGLHYQEGDDAECKLVRCTAGAVFDVAVDLRPQSPTHRRWFATELTSENRRALHVPRGVAHGFQTLEDASEVLYMIDRPYAPAAARGVRWDDPAFAIDWPEAPAGRILSERDAAYPDYPTA